MTKKKDESIDALAKRALSIKVNYELAYKSELIALGADLDAVRLIEVERKSINFFRNAIPQGILILMKEKLNEEINSALAAEANHKQRIRNASFAGESSSGDNSKKKGGDKTAASSSDKSTKKSAPNPEWVETATCHKCGKKGHLASVCRSGNKTSEDKAPEAPVAHTKSSKKDKSETKNENGAGTSSESTVSARTLKAKSMRQ